MVFFSCVFVWKQLKIQIKKKTKVWHFKVKATLNQVTIVDFFLILSFDSSTKICVLFFNKYFVVCIFRWFCFYLWFSSWNLEAGNTSVQSGELHIFLSFVVFLTRPRASQDRNRSDPLQSFNIFLLTTCFLFLLKSYNKVFRSNLKAKYFQKTKLWILGTRLVKPTLVGVILRCFFFIPIGLYVE